MTAGAPPGRSSLTAVTVVVPARDEERALPACLAALARTVEDLATRHPGIRARVLVVLDACTDRSVDVAAACGVEHVEVEARSVGAARALGVELALERGPDPARHWLACTDADTCVPPHWLRTHVAAADDGVDVLVGTVEPDATLPEDLREAWSHRHELVEGHGHVHGANLGLRGSVYRAVGGFAPLRVHEDVDLVQRLRSLPGVRVQATDEHRVVTSSRRQGRTPGGFAGYLGDLAEEVT